MRQRAEWRASGHGGVPMNRDGAVTGPTEHAVTARRRREAGSRPGMRNCLFGDDDAAMGGLGALGHPEEVDSCREEVEVQQVFPCVACLMVQPCSLAVQ
jgi:hypothetical protein